MLDVCIGILSTMYSCLITRLPIAGLGCRPPRELGKQIAAQHLFRGQRGFKILTTRMQANWMIKGLKKLSSCRPQVNQVDQRDVLGEAWDNCELRLLRDSPQTQSPDVLQLSFTNSLWLNAAILTALPL